MTATDDTGPDEAGQGPSLQRGFAIVREALR